MQLVTISLTDYELDALRKICELRNIKSRHRAIKIAIDEYIEDFNNVPKHHKAPNWKLVECPSKK
jgi:metal-responsive CopG/Arc/MetJ family transcriptional regulator